MALKILVCPLNWGLGHATRCIPIIRVLISRRHKIYIGSTGRAAKLLMDEFPSLIHLKFNDFAPELGRNRSMIAGIGLKLPRMLKFLKTEHNELDKLINKHNFDLVISDSRFGLYSINCHTILLIHQLRIPFPWPLKLVEWIAKFVVQSYLKRFNEVWIPDTNKPDNLSGNLSKPFGSLSNLKYIGPISRFEPLNAQEKQHVLLFIISGPEPQRTIFSEIILNQIKDLRGYNCQIILGIPEKDQNSEKITENITVFNHCESEQLNKMMHEASLIISRPGYTTLMDLRVLGKKSLLIPTPEQTEQIYLASRIKKTGLALVVPQKKLDLKIHIKEALGRKGFPKTYIQGSNSRQLIQENFENTFRLINNSKSNS